MKVQEPTTSAADGTVYSKRKGLQPFEVPSLDNYAQVMGGARLQRLLNAAEPLKGLRLLELNATARGGGVAEMLFRSVPFLNLLGIEAEWKVIHGHPEFYEVTKSIHNQLQGQNTSFTGHMEEIYFDNLEAYANTSMATEDVDVVMVHDPQPLGLARYLKSSSQSWIWRCHIDITDVSVAQNPTLWHFVAQMVKNYDASLFSAPQFVVPQWRLPKFIIPPSIDPLSEKNRELSPEEVNRVLDKYSIDPSVPIIAQIGRFDPWKGLERTLEVFRLVRKKVSCQLVLAGGLAGDDPEGVRILTDLREKTAKDEDIHILELSLFDRHENYLEVNALQRAAQVIMQPSTKEGFGLTITEAQWKRKPVVGSEAGGIPMQIGHADTGFMYEHPRQTADQIIQILGNPAMAEAMGMRARKHVEDHFLMPDRMADYLMTLSMVLRLTNGHRLPPDTNIMFHPWVKLRRHWWV